MVNCAFIVFACIGAVVFILGMVTQFAIIPAVIEDQIYQNVILVNNTDQWDRWVEAPFATDFKVYFFNIKNGPEMENGAIPDVEEVGPYIYKQYRLKKDIKIEGDMVSYHQYDHFEFDEEASFPLKEDDLVSVLNIPMFAMIETAALIHPSLLSILNPFLPSIFPEGSGLVLTTTVKKILFDGIVICKNRLPPIVCNVIREFKSKTLRLTYFNIFFSLFEHKQDKHNGRFVVKTGVNNVKELGEIHTWENQTMLDVWGEDRCNMINGTDTTIYAPLIDKKKPIQIYNTDICRSVDIEFYQETNYKGIKGYEFIAYDHILGAPNEEDDNMCFCPGAVKGDLQENGCLKKGTLDMYPCLDAPVVLSFPHLLWADESYQSGVKGLSPDSDKHRITLELEPNTGAPLRGGKRAQFNLFIRPINELPFTHNFNTSLVPIVWLDESLELPDQYVDELQEAFFDLLKIAEIVMWTIISVACALTIVMTALIVVQKTKENKQAAAASTTELMTS